MMIGDRGFRERSAEIHLPYIGHVTETAMLLRGGGVLLMAELDGVPFELEGSASRNGRQRMMNTLLRNLAAENIELYRHVVRLPGAAPRPPVRRHGAFARDLFDAYQDRVLAGRLYHTRLFETLVARPRAFGDRLGGLLARWRREQAQATEATLRDAEDAWRLLSSSLDGYGLRRLGLRERGGVVFSEIAQALRLILQAEDRPVPLVSGHLGAALYSDRIICGGRGIEIRRLGGSLFGIMLCLREYPSRTRVGMLDALLGAAFPFILSQGFCFLRRATADSAISLKQGQMIVAHDPAQSQIAQLSATRDALQSTEVGMGSHHFSLLVLGPSLAQAQENAAAARALLVDAGAVISAESLGNEAALWAQLPGNTAVRTRPGVITTANFAALAPQTNYPKGRAAGRWGPAPLRLRTTGATAFDYDFMAGEGGDVGHTLVLGPTGRGKTVFLGFLLAGIGSALAPNGRVVFFDKDRGGEIMARALGGRYAQPRHGHASGLCPLAALPATEASAGFLFRWIKRLVTQAGEVLTPDEERRLARGIARQMKLPPEQRSLLGVREFLGFSNPTGAGARLEKWCRGGALGWAFDGGADELRLDSHMVGIDMTYLLADPAVCDPAAEYILHRIETGMDGRRTVVAIDEAWAYVRSGRLAEAVDNLLLTMRKLNGALILSTQQPEHLMEDAQGHPVPLGASLVAQCATKILLPNPDAREAAYRDELGCTAAEYEAVAAGMLGRKLLVKRHDGSVIVDFDLSALREHLAVLSARKGTLNLLDGLRAELGNDPDDWLPRFLADYPAARD